MNERREEINLVQIMYPIIARELPIIFGGFLILAIGYHRIMSLMLKLLS
jgi:hypothetical protein